MAHRVENILECILAEKRKEVEALGRTGEQSGSPEPLRDFRSALEAGRMAVIAEFKRASPSGGWIKREADPADIAGSYQCAGASALSVLTDAKFFGGSREDLIQARSAVSIPVLRKDFIISEEQIYETRAMPADSLLLIVGCLSSGSLYGLLDVSRQLGLEPLVEVHNEAELERAVEAGAEIIGINNRDLKTFKVDLGTTLRLRPHIPDGKIVVSESGIKTPDDIKRLRDAGVDAVLIGEAFMREEDPGEALEDLLTLAGLL